MIVRSRESRSKHKDCCEGGATPKRRDDHTGAVLRESDVLFLTESLWRRTLESKDWTSPGLKSEVLWLADCAEKWLQSGADLRYGLLMVRSLALVNRPREALARLDSTMAKLQTVDRM